MALLIDVRELAARLEEVLAAATAGEDVIVTDGTKPRAHLVPLTTPVSAANSDLDATWPGE